MKTYVSLIIFAFISNSLLSQVFVAENPNIRVTLKNNINLSVAGDFTNNDTIFGTGFLQLVQDKVQSVSGNGILEKFRINKTGGQAEILSGNQDVIRLFEIHGGTFIPNKRITLKSVDTLTAQIGINTGGSITGDFIIERFIPESNRAFRFMSTPVSTSGTILDNLQEGVNNTGTNYPADNINPNPGYGTHITGSKTGNNGFDATLSGNPSMFKWDETSQSYTTVSNTNTKTFAKGENFVLFIRGSRATNLNSNTTVGSPTTLRLTGNPTILDFSKPKELSLEADGNFILLGNPYHGAIDVNKFLTHNSGISSNFMYVFDPRLNTFGGYATVELPGGTNGQGSNANEFIQAWQSVFVRGDNLTTSISFLESDKDISGSQVPIFRGNTETRVNLKLLSENRVIDGVSLKLKQGANSEIDQNDADKFPNPGESLSIYSHGKNLSIEERDFPQSKDTILIRLVNKNKENYKFLIDGDNISQIDGVFKDFYLDEEHALQANEDMYIDYQVVDNEPDIRFGFIIGSESLSTDEFTSKNFKIYPNPAQNVLNIEALNSSSETLKFKIYSLLGQKVAEGEFKNQNKISNYNISTFSAGVYLVVITDDKDLKETLKFIKI